MSDYAHKQVDKEIKATTIRLRREYKQASREVQAKLDDYLRRFEIKDQKWQEWVETGYKTKKQYKDWRVGQIAVGKRWRAMQEELAQDYANVNKLARQIVRGKMPEIYALNHNWGTYIIEKQAKLDTGYTLYSAETVEFLMKDNPKLLPDPGAAVSRNIINGLDTRYNRQQLQSVMMQSILQGDSLPEMSQRVAMAVGEKNYKSAIRNARTMYTCAQNAGRLGSYRRAEDMGIEINKQWVATLDGRTRHAHRLLDGQIVPVNEPFDSEFHDDIMYPGDPDADPGNVYNCRCTMISQIKGHEIDSTSYREDPDIGDMTYEEWKDSKPEYSNPIDLPERKQQAIKMKYINEYRRGGKKK